MKGWREAWKDQAVPTPTEGTPFTPVPPDSSSLFGAFLSPIHTWQPSTRLLKGNTRFLKRDPSLLSRDSCSQWKKSPCGIQPGWQCWAEEGGKFARDLVACGLLPHLLLPLPQGRQLPVLRARHLLPKNEKIWLFSQVLPGKATWKTPGTSKIFIHGKQLPQRNPRVNHPNLLNPIKFEFKTKCNRMSNGTCFFFRWRGRKTIYIFHLYSSTLIFFYHKYIVF